MNAVLLPIVARPHRLAWPRTLPFQGSNTGSNPVGDTIDWGARILLRFQALGDSFLFRRFDTPASLHPEPFQTGADDLTES